MSLNVCENVPACLFSLEVDKVCWYNFQNKSKQQVIIEQKRIQYFQNSLGAMLFLHLQSRVSLSLMNKYRLPKLFFGGGVHTKQLT